MSQVVAAVVLVLILVLAWVLYTQREHMGEVFYLNQLTMKNTDPITYYYTRRERDVTGMSQEDYYYENDTNSRNLVAPQYLEGDTKWQDHTDYLGMPLEHRPMKPASATRMQMMPDL